MCISLLSTFFLFSNTDVKSYLKRFLAESQEFMERYDDIVELCVLFVYCFEVKHCKFRKLSFTLRSSAVFYGEDRFSLKVILQ